MLALSCLVLSPFLFLFLIKLSLKKQYLIDEVNARKIHQRPTPRIGGVGVGLIFFVSSLICSHFQEKISPDYFLLFDFPKFVTPILLIFFVGLIDDFIDLKGTVKLLLQISISALAYFLCDRLTIIHIPIVGSTRLLPTISLVLTVFWLVGITNTINLIDGIDGLCSGVTAISSFAFSIIAFHTGQKELFLILMLLMISAISFLPYNWFVAKCFVGDSGAYLYGFTLALASILICYNSGELPALTYSSVIILGLPIADTTYAILRRLTNREPLFAGDRGHLHHKLIEFGFSKVQTVLILYGISLIYAAIGTAFLFISANHAFYISLIVIAVTGIVVYLIDRKETK